jgi:hypothetical protein
VFCPDDNEVWATLQQTHKYGSIQSRECFQQKVKNDTARKLAVLGAHTHTRIIFGEVEDLAPQVALGIETCVGKVSVGQRVRSVPSASMKWIQNKSMHASKGNSLLAALSLIKHMPN